MFGAVSPPLDLKIPEGIFEKFAQNEIWVTLGKPAKIRSLPTADSHFRRFGAEKAKLTFKNSKKRQGWFLEVTLFFDDSSIAKSAEWINKSA